MIDVDRISSSAEPNPNPPPPPTTTPPLWKKIWKGVQTYDYTQLKDRRIVASLATGAAVVITKIASDFENSAGIKAVCYLLLAGQVAVVAKTVYDLALPHLQKLGKEEKCYRKYVDAGCYLIPATVSLVCAAATFSVLPNLIRDVARPLIPFLAGAATGAAACYFAMKKGT